MISIFGSRIKGLMQVKKLTQKELALLSNISQSTISQYVKGVNQPRAEELSKLADALDVSMDYLWGRTDINNIALPRKAATNPQALSLAKQLVRALDSSISCDESSSFYAAETDE